MINLDKLNPLANMDKGFFSRISFFKFESFPALKGKVHLKSKEFDPGH